MTPATNRTALVLTGGGARGAYQVGVLKALAELLPDQKTSPFAILCGSSAGAINAAALACHASRFKAGVRRLEHVWGNFHSGQIYRVDSRGMLLNSLQWMASLFRPRRLPSEPHSLLDNAPLRALLARLIRFDQIEAALDRGHLAALSVTCSGYSSGESVSFFEGRPELEPWQRFRRAGAKTRIGLDHLMASSAIPLLFPAVKIHREFFGDGSVRFLSPISPALHLGAERVMIIGAAGTEQEDRKALEDPDYPSIAEVAGQVLDSVFIDSLNSDLEVLQRINQTLDRLPAEARSGPALGLKHIDALVISPSQSLAGLSSKHVRSLPPVVR
ncbi:MAG: patatin-like phospholipase family protein [Geothrix sp.]|nr:patatin-like phospholipase family protein [Geothrix sp.]